MLSALPVLYPSDDTWALVDSRVDPAGEAGERFGFADLLIAALARESGSLLGTLDADFARMAALGCIDLYEP